MVVGGYCISASENYSCLNRKTRFGLIRKESGLTSIDVDLIMSSNEDNFAYRDFSVKRLKPCELDMFPAIRFHNNVVLFDYSGMKACFPVPVALLYRGNNRSIIKSPPEDGFYVTQTIKGIRLTDRIERLDKASLENVIKTLTYDLRSLSDKGMFPLDLSPQDIFLLEAQRDTLEYPVPLVFANTEHVRFNGSIVDNEGSDEFKEIRERLSEAQRLWLRELYRGYYIGNL